MADKSPAGDSLIKKEADLPEQDPITSRSTSGWMMVCALLMLVSIAWALWDEAIGQRPWKGIQKEFVARYSRYLDSIKSRSGKSEAEVKESPEYQQLDADYKAAIDEVKAETDSLQKEADFVNTQLSAITEPFQDQRGHLTVTSYNIETSHGSAQKRYRQQAEDQRQKMIEVEIPKRGGGVDRKRLKYTDLEALYTSLRDKKAELLGQKAEKLKKPSELQKKRDDYLRNHLVGLGPTQIAGLKSKMKDFDYSIRRYR